MKQSVMLLSVFLTSILISGCGQKVFISCRTPDVVRPLYDHFEKESRSERMKQHLSNCTKKDAYIMQLEAANMVCK